MRLRLTKHCNNSQIFDAAVQHCEEVLHSFISVTRDQTNRRESRDPSQLSVQLLPLHLRQQVSFVQHQYGPVSTKSCSKKGREGIDQVTRQGLPRAQRFLFGFSWCLSSLSSLDYCWIAPRTEIALQLLPSGLIMQDRAKSVTSLSYEGNILHHFNMKVYFLELSYKMTHHLLWFCYAHWQ